MKRRTEDLAGEPLSRIVRAGLQTPNLIQINRRSASPVSIQAVSTALASQRRHNFARLPACSALWLPLASSSDLRDRPRLSSVIFLVLPSADHRRHDGDAQIRRQVSGQKP